MPSGSSWTDYTPSASDPLGSTLGVNFSVDPSTGAVAGGFQQASGLAAVPAGTGAALANAQNPIGSLFGNPAMVILVIAIIVIALRE